MAARSIVDEYGMLFAPRTVAVVGASTKSTTLANVFMRRIRKMGFDGSIYPIHPEADAIDGVRAYPSLGDTPQPVDYAYIAVAAPQVPALLAAGGGRVRFAQVISSGFGEVEEGKALQHQLAAAARAGGMRLIGPNCLGLHAPRGRITFVEDATDEAGHVGVVSQSGGLGIDMVRRGMAKGVRYSGLVSVGNCADVQTSDILEYYCADPETRVIALYVETARDARRIFEILRDARARKPVVMLKGGRTRQGTAAASSHTGALAGDERAWIALSRQTGCVLVETLDQFMDALLVFQALTPRPSPPTRRVVLFGNGGGASVLAVDYFARRGLDVLPFGAETTAALAALKLPPGTTIANPVDCPVGTLRQEDGRVAGKILAAIYASGAPDALVMHLNMNALTRASPQVLDNLVQEALQIQARHPGRAHFVLVLRSDGELELEARKRKFRASAVRLGIPVYDELSDAGDALAALQFHERFVQSRAAADDLCADA
jgi:acyl-CoA synthetase (NDP forming)